MMHVESVQSVNHGSEPLAKRSVSTGHAQPSYQMATDSIQRPTTDRAIAEFIKSVPRRSNPMLERELTVDEAIKHRIALNADPTRPYHDGGVALNRNEKLSVWYEKAAGANATFDQWKNAKVVAVYRKRNNTEKSIARWSNHDDFEAWDGNPKLFKIAKMKLIPKRFAAQMRIIWKSVGRTMSDHKFCGMNAGAFVVTTLGGNGLLYIAGYVSRIAADQPASLPSGATSSTAPVQEHKKKKKEKNPDMMYLAAALAYLSITGISFLAVPALLELKGARQKLAFKDLEHANVDVHEKLFAILKDEYAPLVTQAAQEQFGEHATNKPSKPYEIAFAQLNVADEQASNQWLKIEKASVTRQLQIAHLLKRFISLPTAKTNHRLSEFVDWNIRLLEHKETDLSAISGLPEQQKQAHSRFVQWLNEVDKNAYRAPAVEMVPLR